jgi:hypothetical protein
MVHALEEAWRVLVSRGILVDLRPLCIDIPLEILSPAGSESAGLVDMSPDIDKDIAAEAATQAVVRDGFYQELKRETFDFAYYWNTVREFKADLDERWKDEVILHADVLKNARVMYKKLGDAARVRIRIRMLLAKFAKL